MWRLEQMQDDLRTDVLERLSKKDWSSDERRSYLQRLGTLTAASKIRVKFANCPTASCEWNERRGYHVIRMRSDEIFTEPIKQKFGIGEQMTYTLMQEGFLYHELGHVLMSDYDAWMEAVNQFSSLKKQAMFKQFLNCTEDVVIEAWLRRKYNCGKILDFKNEVKFYGITGVSVGDEFNFYEGNVADPFSTVLNMIESMGRFDGKFLEWVGEETKPSHRWERENAHATFEKHEGTCRELISQAVREPNARKRYDIIADAFDVVYSNMSQENPADESQFSPKNEMGGGQEMEGGQIPIPEPPEGEEEDGEEEEEGDGKDSGNNQEEQDTNGDGGSTVNREARSVEEILNGRSPKEVKVVM